MSGSKRRARRIAANRELPQPRYHLTAEMRPGWDTPRVICPHDGRVAEHVIHHSEALEMVLENGIVAQHVHSSHQVTLRPCGHVYTYIADSECYLINKDERP